MTSRREINKMTRRELRAFLEGWGYAVYADEPISELRQTALEHAEQGPGELSLHPAFVPGKGFPER